MRGRWFNSFLCGYISPLQIAPDRIPAPLFSPAIIGAVMTPLMVAPTLLENSCWGWITLLADRIWTVVPAEMPYDPHQQVISLVYMTDVRDDPDESIDPAAQLFKQSVSALR